MIVADKKKLIFIHIYKTGGSSITSWLSPYITENFRSKYTKTSGPRWQDTWHLDRTQHSKFSDSLLILDKHNLELDDYLKFVFVRNPYSWILSIWNNFYQSPYKNLPQNLKNSMKFRLRSLLNKKMDSQYFYEMYPGGSFSDFILFIDDVVSNNPQLINKIWGATDQYSFINNDRNIKFDFIGHFENLQEDLNSINNMLNLQNELKIPKKSVSNSKHNRQNYLSYYDSKSIRIVNKMFARDFQFFNYQPINV